jgi:hypothetical protein
LLGGNISPSDAIDVFNYGLASYKYHHRHLKKSDVTMESMKIKYDGDRRIATNRNVIELKREMVAVRASIPVRFWGFAWRKGLYVLLAFMSVFFLIHGMSFMLSQIVVRPEWIPCFSNDIFVEECYVPAIELESSIGVLTLLDIIGVAFLLVMETLYFLRFKQKVIQFCFVPHLVSCVLADFDRQTNRSVALTSVRQKIRRLACLPLPDKDHLQLMLGTENVVLILLEKNDFFWERAVSFRQPD